MLLKYCPGCATLLPTCEFHRNRAQCDGLCSQCRDCAAAQRALRGPLNPHLVFQYCRACGDLLPLTDFDRHVQRPLGRLDRCRVCRRLARLERATVEHHNLTLT